uniref:adenylate cyclase n=1 Tax=Globodera rostochiensis TaxID=31243 RepID=A0A914H5T7_GLORO
MMDDQCAERIEHVAVDVDSEDQEGAQMDAQQQQAATGQQKCMTNKRLGAALRGDRVTLRDKYQKSPSSNALRRSKTIATTYMAASGLTGSSTGNSHVVAVVNFALALFGGPEELNENSSGNFNLHIGRDVGPVVVGVIGTEKPHYDIWGNMVNVARRICTRQGFRDQFSAKASTRVPWRNHRQGKGLTTTFLLRQRKGAARLRGGDGPAQFRR